MTKIVVKEAAIIEGIILDTFSKKEYSDLRNAVNSLKEKEKSVIIKRFGLDGKAPMSLSEIGAEMGYSKERIRQIEVQGLSLLKNRFEHNAYRPDRKLVI